MHAFLVPLAAALVAATPHSARTHDTFVTGRVTDAATARAIAGARITSDAGASAITDGEGRYRLPVNGRRADPGIVTLRVRAIGYEPLSREVRLLGETTTADFALAASHVALDEMVATGAAAARDRRLRQHDKASRPEVNAGSPPMAMPAVGQSIASAHAEPWRGRPGGVPFNTEEYRRIEENTFLAVRDNPRSTFSIDVDRASYANVRRFLRSGTQPPRDAVRIEELINYFTYDYPAPDGDMPFSVTTDVAAAPWAPSHRIVRIGLQARKLDVGALPPNNLVFLVDVSGSMMTEDKLPLLKSSLRLLVDQLRPQDRVAMVVYAGQAGLVLPSTSGADKARIRDAIDALEAGGSTNGGQGIQLAYDVAREHFLRKGNNRVILCTDGDFNVGVTSEGELTRLIEKRREEGTNLTVLGFGTGNLADARMEQLADKGNGNFAYIDDILEAKKALVHEIGGTLFTIAKDVKLQVEFNPAAVRAYRLIGYENRLLADEDFTDDRKDAGDMGAGHSVTALYEVVPVGAETDVAIRERDPLRYRSPGAVAEPARNDELLYVKLRYKSPEGGPSRELAHPVRNGMRAPSADLSFTMAVAGFGMLLRDSEHRGRLSWEDVERLAEAGRGRDAEGYRAEFVQLVRLAAKLPRSPLAVE